MPFKNVSSYSNFISRALPDSMLQRRSCLQAFSDFSKPKYPLKIQIKTWSGKMTNNPYKASVYIALSNKNNFFVGYQPCPSPSIHKWTSLHCDLPQVCNIGGLAWSLNQKKNVWKVTKFIHKLFHIYNETIPACPLAFIIDNPSSLYAWTQESETRLCKNFT